MGEGPTGRSGPSYENRFRLMVDGIKDYGIFLLEPDGTIATWNTGAELLEGYTADEVIGRHFSLFYTDEQRAAGHPERELEQAREHGRYEEETWRVRKDGTLLWLNVVITALRDESGELLGFSKVTRDMTARRQSETMFEGLLEAAPDAMIGVDADGLIRMVNGQAERLFGYPRAELLGGPIEALVPDRARALHPKHRMSYFQSPEVRPMGAGLELSGRRKDGTEFPAEISLSSIESESGLLVTAAVRDVTERKAFEDVVARARDTAEKAARARQEFLANMSHEIRTPMNAVIGMTSLLLGTELDAEQRDYVETVRTSGDHLLTIINDILDYSKIDAGKIVLEDLPFDVRTWLADSMDLVVVSAHDKGLEVVCDVDPAVPAVLVGDSGRLRQVLVNLTSNAVKFTEQGEVVVRLSLDHAERDGVQLRVTVADTGVGVAADQVGMLFDPFTQADTTTTRMYGGTGLGLAICRQLVERMGGTISMRSTPGVGTTVTFTFLTHVGDTDQAPVPTDDLAGKRALIVDDNATNRLLLETWLTGQGVAFVSVSGSAEALAVVDHDRDFDIALLDLMMPVMDGAELGVLLRGRLPKTKLFLLTSAGPYARQVAGRETFDAAMSKPVVREALFEVMGRLLTGSAARPTPADQAVSVFDLPGTASAISILVVEDNAVNQKVARHLLGRFGFRADVASSGREAVAALSRRGYDLVLMDVQMPDMDGLAATREIRRRWPGRARRIVAMTANVAPEDARECREAGMDGFLGKPIAVEELAKELALAAPPDGMPLGGLAGDPAVELPHSRDRGLIDAAALSLLCEQIGADSVRELAGMYFDDLTGALVTLEGAAQAQDRQEVAATAHKIKSSSRALGAVELFSQLHAIEQLAAEADWPRLGELVAGALDCATRTRAVLTAELAGR